MRLVRLDVPLSPLKLARACSIPPERNAKAVVEKISKSLGQKWHFTIPVEALLEATNYYGGASAVSFRQAITLALAGRKPYMSHAELNFLFGQAKFNAVYHYDLPRLRIPHVQNWLVTASDIRALLVQSKSLRAVPGAIDGLMAGKLSLAHLRTVSVQYSLHPQDVKGYLMRNDIPRIEIPFRHPIEGNTHSLFALLPQPE